MYKASLSYLYYSLSPFITIPTPITSLDSTFSRLSLKSMSVAASTSTSLGSWCRKLPIDPVRFVQKVEICSALATGEDAWGTPVDQAHYHTLLRVSLVPSPDGARASEDVLLIERVLSTGGAYHSVTPISETFSGSPGGSLFHPDVHDRVCVTIEGSSDAPARHLDVERTLVFGDGFAAPRLALVQLARILDFVSRATLLICAGGDCKFQSRSFAFTCMAALCPNFPPPTVGRKTGRGVCMNSKHGENIIDDIVFEQSAEGFLCHVPWLVQRGDTASKEALLLMLSLKG